MLRPKSAGAKYRPAAIYFAGGAVESYNRAVFASLFAPRGAAAGERIKGGSLSAEIRRSGLGAVLALRVLR